MSDYFEEGHELYLREPELLLIEVWRRALSTWTDAEREAFVGGYYSMRRQREQRESERATPVSAHQEQVKS